MRRIAAEYGVGYDTFLRHALGRTGPGARELDRASDEEIARLSAGTGVSVEQLEGMRTGAAMARVNERTQGWLLAEAGREALEQLRVSVMRMVRRAEADRG